MANWRYLLATSWLCASILTGSPAWARPDSSLDRTMIAFLRAIAVQDRPTAEGFCTEGFRARAHASCSVVLGRLVDSRAMLKYKSSEQVGSRAIVGFDLVLEGRAVAQMWFYTVFDNASWRIDAASSQEADVRERMTLASQELSSGTLPGIADALGVAVAEGNAERLRELCTKAFWEASEDSAQGLLRQAEAKGLGFKRAAWTMSENRGLVTFDVMRDGIAVDRVWMYAVRTNDVWAFDAVDEIEGHADAYVAGSLPSRLDTLALPSDPAVDAVGEALAVMVRGGQAPEPVPWLNRDLQNQIEGLGRDASYLRSYWLESSGTGVVCFETGTEHRWLSVRRVDDGFRLGSHPRSARRCAPDVQDFL